MTIPKSHQKHTTYAFKKSILRILVLSSMAETSQGGYILNESLTTLNRSWCTEANALEILPFKTGIVAELKGQLTAQQVCFIADVQ